MGRYRRRLQPSMGEFKRMVGLVVSTEAKMSVIEILNAIRSRCPEWTVTPCRLRKALAALHAETNRGDAPQSGKCRIYPHDVVELRPGSRKQKLRRMWRGQVYRVSGYDDGASSDEELPPGRCSVSWIGDNLHQTPGLRMKESSLQLIDRPFVIGDRVSAVKDPQSLGLVVDVRCTCRFSSNPPPSQPYPEVAADRVRAVGGFRMEEVVAHDEFRWVGRVIDALFRVEVEIVKRCEGRRGKSKLLGKCAFQVSSEGLSGLTPLDDGAADQACAQELCPHFPGQQVRATPRVWRQAEWLEDCSQLSRKQARGPPICGKVTSVSCEMVGVHWVDAWSSKVSMPPEWVHPSTVRRLSMNNSPSEGWLLGEHCQAWDDPSAPCAVLTRTTTHTTVQWAGDVEEEILAIDLMPRQAFYSHDFLPHDYVARTADVDRYDPRRAVETLQSPNPNVNVQDGSVQYGSAQTELNEDDRNRELFATFLGQVNNEDIIPAVRPPAAGQVVPMGVVKSVDLKARTALVEWRCTLQDNPQEVSLFELAPHPLVDVRLADVVFIPPDQQSQDSGAWVGRVTAFSGFSAQVQLACGLSEWFDVEALRIADMDGHYESSESSDEEPGTASFEEELHDPSMGGSRDASPRRVDAESEEEFEHCEQPQSETSEGSSSSTRAPEILAFDVLEDVSPCDHKFVDRPSPPPKVLMRAVRREHSVLQKGLLDGGEGVVAPIAVRTYASRSDLFRAMVVGPPGTPYSDVPFFFDMSLSPQYPSEPPLVHFMAAYVSSCEKLNPNLYNDGKVCLSILGTWAGPGWDPQKSTLLQVLISLQGLVLVEDPYFNEPGHEWECNSEHGRNASALYNENVRLLVLRAALNVSKHPPSGFEEMVASHFARHGPRLLAECEEALLDVNASRTSEGFRKVLANVVMPGLREHWGSASSPPV